MKRLKVFLVLKLTIILVVIAVIATTTINDYEEHLGIKFKISKPGKEYADISKPGPTRDSVKEIALGSAQFGVDLNLQGMGSDRVLQNFAIDDSNGEIYTVQDESNSNNNLLVNKLTSEGKSLGHITLTNLGHGNGLGFERLPDNSIRLWTDYVPVDSHGYGTQIARFNFDNPSEVSSYDLCPKGYKVPFVTIDNDNRTLLMRAVNKKTKEELIFVFSLDEVLKGGKKPKLSFAIDSAQRIQSFQGLHVKDNVIYILTGDSSIYTPKLLYGYDQSGKVLFRKRVKAGSDFAADNGGYYEPEGLYIYKNPETGEKRVYVGIVTGLPYNAQSNPRGRISQLYFYEDFK